MLYPDHVCGSRMLCPGHFWKKSRQLTRALLVKEGPNIKLYTTGRDCGKTAQAAIAVEHGQYIVEREQG
jgi:hypothetical protein